MTVTPSPALQIELLSEEQSQLIFFRDRHYRWMKDTEDKEVHYLHTRVANLLKETIDEYDDLLGALQMQRG